MSTIPPNWLGSIIQGSGAQSRAADARRREQAAEGKSVSGDAFADGLHNVIENSDRDSSVDVDGEGGGSQGRAGDDGGDGAPGQPASGSSVAEGGLDVQA